MDYLYPIYYTLFSKQKIINRCSHFPKRMKTGNSTKFWKGQDNQESLAKRKIMEQGKVKFSTWSLRTRKFRYNKQNKKLEVQFQLHEVKAQKWHKLESSFWPTMVQTQGSVQSLL